MVNPLEKIGPYAYDNTVGPHKIGAYRLWSFRWYCANQMKLIFCRFLSWCVSCCYIPSSDCRYSMTSLIYLHSFLLVLHNFHGIPNFRTLHICIKCTYCCCHPQALRGKDGALALSGNRPHGREGPRAYGDPELWHYYFFTFFGSSAHAEINLWKKTLDISKSNSFTVAAFIQYPGNFAVQVIACPHCRTKVTVSQKFLWDCRRKVRLPPNSATVTVFRDSLTFVRQCGQDFTLQLW